MRQIMKEVLKSSNRRLGSQQGVTASIVAIMIVVLLGFTALAIDISHLYVVRNELQNASDAGALSGARFLYNADGTAVNTDANQIAFDTASANKSEKVAVDLHWTSGTNDGDVQRGHWSFATKTFTPNASTAPVDLWDVSTAELDADINFINAVRVRARREDTPAASFFAGIFGHNSFILSTESIAYIGFAGTLEPEEVDMPIAICQDSILIDGKYSCSIGRMINSGQDAQTSEAGGWTSFNQEGDPCTGGTNAKEVGQIIDPPGPETCYGKNSGPITLGEDMATMGGEVETVLSKLRDCWKEATDSDGNGIPDTPWNLTLPVITCPSNNVGTCEEVVGAVNLNIVWITGEGTNACIASKSNLPPLNMGEWSCTNQKPVTQADFDLCWGDFVNHFNLQNVDGSSAPCKKKSLYFQPDCEPHIPSGKTGGENFGILAKIPVLVK